MIRSRSHSLLVAPALSWLVFFFLIPLGIVTVYSFAQKGVYGGVEYLWNIENFSRAADLLYLGIFWNSVKLASLTAVSCLLIGFPMAYVMATANASVSRVLMVLVVIPFWTNFVVRVYAIKLFLSSNGPLGEWTVRWGLEQGPIAIWLGMVTNYLPFMVLPLYVVLEKFDFTLMDAARDLGAKRLDLLFRILIPLVRPGIVTGLIFVFTPALGEFVIPDMLGGARSMLVGNLMTDQFLRSRDWPFGSALAILLMALVAICLWLYLSQQEGATGNSEIDWVNKPSQRSAKSS